MIPIHWYNTIILFNTLKWLEFLSILYISPSYCSSDVCYYSSISYVYLVFKCAVIYYIYPPTCGKIDWHSLIECTVQNYIEAYISHITSWYSQYYNRYYSVMIGASLSEPHSSRRNGTNVAFTKIYMEIWINGMSVMHSQKFMFNKLIF